MEFKDYRKETRLDWGTIKEPGITGEEIEIGCLLRIADSLEKIEEPYIELLQIIENYKYLEIENKKLKKIIAGLRGYINKKRGE